MTALNSLGTYFLSYKIRQKSKGDVGCSTFFRNPDSALLSFAFGWKSVTVLFCTVASWQSAGQRHQVVRACQRQMISWFTQTTL